MNALTFDTLAYTKTLREAGIDEKQAEAQTIALVNVLKNSTDELATKADIEQLKVSTKADLKEETSALRADIERLEARLSARMDVMEERTTGRFTLLQWMAGFNLAFCVAILWLLIRTMI